MNEKIESIIAGLFCMIGLFGVIFIVLKLTGNIDWSWLLVTAPFWGSVAILWAVAITLLISVFLYNLLDRKL